MSKINPNNLEKALAEVNAFAENYGITAEIVNKVPQEIKETDRGCNFVILLKINHNSGTKKNEYYMNVQALNERQLKKLMDKKVQSISYDKAILLHKAEEVTNVVKETQAPAQTNGIEDKLAEATKQLSEKDARIAELEAKLKEKETAGAGTDTKTAFDYKTAKKDELIAFCLEKGLELKGEEKVDELRTMVEKFIELTKE